jgi:hypothetical protein
MSASYIDQVADFLLKHQTRKGRYKRLSKRQNARFGSLWDQSIEAYFSKPRQDISQFESRTFSDAVYEALQERKARR